MTEPNESRLVRNGIEEPDTARDGAPGRAPFPYPIIGAIIAIGIAWVIYENYLRYYIR